MNKIFFLLLAILSMGNSYAQLYPPEGSKLNYRIVGFSFPKITTGNQLKLEVANGNYTNADSFARHIICSYMADSGKVIGEVPDFGKEYTWRITAQPDNSKSRSVLHHFTTLQIPEVDTNKYRLRVLKHADEYKDAYVFLDGNRVLYDMKGAPVWFMPELDNQSFGTFRAEDIKATRNGTITLMCGRRNAMICEVDYNGNILWKGPNSGVVSGDRVEHYSHQFSKLANGNYMVLAGKYVSWKLPSVVNSSVLLDPDMKNSIKFEKGRYFQKIAFMTVIEYDKKGKVVWSLQTSRYFKQGEGVYATTNDKGIYDKDEMLANSFYFDQHEMVIYLSFRDLGKIYKIAYPDGKLLCVYDGANTGTESKTQEHLFCWQHSCFLSENGYLYMFNNNACERALPEITVIDKHLSEKNNVRKLWEYACTIDGFNFDKNENSAYVFGSGGNVAELDSGVFFSCMSNLLYTKVFIVNRDKELLWSALPERWNSVSNKWECVNSYRASIIKNREQLYDLIWNNHWQERLKN